ncbi:hypothetical protein GCM10009755_00900 [Brevibacterium samyangense]|uniref:Uncharacterized protein n=1 Tax=Brevibacterium samyangense TaxID=366888 RepID=A0ABP5EK08_9MICO
MPLVVIRPGPEVGRASDDLAVPLTSYTWVTVRVGVSDAHLSRAAIQLNRSTARTIPAL